MSEKLSFSKLNTYRNCPYRYDLMYNKRIFIDGVTLASLYGALIHKIEERIFNYILSGGAIPYDELKEDFMNYNIPNRKGNKKDGIFGVKILKKTFPTDWKKRYWKTLKNYDDKVEDYLNYGIYWLENFLKNNPTIKPIRSEFKFEYEYKGYVFSGAIDRIFYNSATGEYIIHDIKTKENPYKEKELINPLQFVIYKNAMEKEYGKGAKFVFEFYMPTINLLQKTKINGKSNLEIDEIISGIISGNFEPNITVYCNLCGYNDTPNCNASRGGVK